MNRPRLLNIHIELTYPKGLAPTYTSPGETYVDHTEKLMNFWEVANKVGPGIVFSSLNNEPFWQLDSEHNPTPEIDRWYLLDEPVIDVLPMTIQGNSQAQMAATGKAKGIAYYEIWVDKSPVETIRVDQESPVAYFVHDIILDTKLYSNGLHELFIQAFDVDGNPSTFDAFQAHATPGEYLPTIINIQNLTTAADLTANDDGIELYPNPTSGQFKIKGNLMQYQIHLLNAQGILHQDLSTSNNELNIDVGNLPDGLYFVKVINNNNSSVTVQKIIKNN